MAKRKVRLADVAREAGVSVATVDRVVNGRPGVKPHTQQLIRETMKSLEMPQLSLPASLQVAASMRPLSFDFILPAGPNTFMQNLENAALSAADDTGLDHITIRCHRVTGFNPAALAETIAKVGRNTDGMAVVALENPVVREAVNTLSGQEVPVVTLVSDLSSAPTIGYVGLDNRAAGRTAGYLMGRFASGRQQDATGSVVMIAGSLSLNYRDHEEREMGFRHALNEQFPGLQIVDRIENQDDYEKAYEQMNDVLERRPELLGIYNIGAGNRGIGNVLQERGVNEGIIFIGHELTSFSRQFLIGGTMDAVINQSPGNQARAAVQMLNTHLNGETIDAALGRTPIEIFVRENLP